MKNVFLTKGINTIVIDYGINTDKFIENVFFLKSHKVISFDEDLIDKIKREVEKNNTEIIIIKNVPFLFYTRVEDFLIERKILKDLAKEKFDKIIVILFKTTIKQSNLLHIHQDNNCIGLYYFGEFVPKTMIYISQNVLLLYNFEGNLFCTVKKSTK